MSLEFFRNPDLNARAEGMAMSMIIASMALVMVLIYMWVSRRSVRGE